MEKIVLKGEGKNVTVVSNIFLDNYMIKANGEYVKVYLYLLRCLSGSDRELTIGYLADVLEHTENDIIRAIKYWAAQGLLTVGYNNKEIAYIEIKTLGEYETDHIAATVVHDEPVKEQSSGDIKASEDKETKKELPTDKLAELLRDDEVKMLLYIVQKYMGKTLSPSETNKILYFYDGLKFSSELIEYLIEYCVSNNHKSFGYIEKVAISWHEEGISTVEEAKKHATSYSKLQYSILKAFGISGRNLGETEKEFVIKWTDQYGFSTDIIVEACNRTIMSVANPSFKYADSVLQKWKKKGVRTVADLKAIDDEYERSRETKAANASKKAAVSKTSSFSNFSQRTYDNDDMEKLERLLLQRR
ncbi:MAG: DnaD domain protein [Lachnospiraceae bacterium]